MANGTDDKNANHIFAEYEEYPDIYDRSLQAGEDNKTNVANKRLYIAVRHLLSELFGIDREGRSAKEPSDFPDSFCPINSDGTPKYPGNEIHLHATEEKVRFAAVYGQMLLAGYGDPSFGRMERWNRLLIDMESRTQDQIRTEEENLFPRGSIRFENPENLQCGKWTPPSKRAGDPGDPTAPACENFGTEVNPDPGGDPERIGFRVLITREFVAEFTGAVQKYNANSGLYRQVFFGLRREGQGPVNGPNRPTKIFTAQLAAVTERLIADGVSANDPQIGRRVTNAISRSISGGGAGGDGSDTQFSAFSIDLPDLDAGTHVEIIPDNLNAIRVIYFVTQLQKMKLYACVGKVVEHANLGWTPISRGAATDRIYTWMKETPRRINEIEIQGLSARTFGLADGPVEDAVPNREFTDLWLRFLSTVSQKFREITSTDRDLVSVEQIHKSGRDLAVNLSLHGFGIVHPAAIELQDMTRDVIAMLSEPELLRAYGVRDIWQLVDRVSTLYLGGAANGVKYRTMAASGERIIQWLADRATVLSSASAVGLNISVQGPYGRTPTTEFRNLAELAERWLAVTGTADSTAEQNTDPVDLQVQNTVPMLGQNISFPQSVQDTLQQVGVNAPDLAVLPQA